jgi:hypothetical protein
MNKVCVLAGLAALLPGCLWPTVTWKGPVAWPDEGDPSVKTVVSLTEAGAALAAAGAIREFVRTNKDPRLFRGCSSPEQGLDVAVFTGPTPGLYYVVLDEHFNRCGGPRGRVLDWHYVYAVTPQGEVVAEDPIGPAEAPATPPPRRTPSSPEYSPSPTAPPPTTGASASAPTGSSASSTAPTTVTPPLLTGPGTPAPTPPPSPSPAPATQHPATPSPASPSPIPPG